MDLSPDLKEMSIRRVGGVAYGCSFNCMINAGAIIAVVETANGRLSILIGALLSNNLDCRRKTGFEKTITAVMNKVIDVFLKNTLNMAL